MNVIIELKERSTMFDMPCLRKRRRQMKPLNEGFWNRWKDWLDEPLSPTQKRLHR